MKSASLMTRCCIPVLIMVTAGIEMGFAESSWSQTPPPPVVTSSTPPSDVEIPEGFRGNPIAFFDDFSWKTFIALVWPALEGERGVPDPKQTVDGSGLLRPTKRFMRCSIMMDRRPRLGMTSIPPATIRAMWRSAGVILR